MTKQINRFNRLLLAVFILPTLIFVSCEKDDPVPEDPLEQYDGMTIRFTEVEMHGDHHHDVEDPETAEIKFRYEDGSVVLDGETHLHLTEGLTYLTEITALDAGQPINEDFEPELHQFFFTGAPEGVLDYAYIDKDRDGRGVGFEGYLTVLKETEVGFDFTVALVHYSREGDKPEIAWNDPDYPNKIAGLGHHDFEGTFEFHPVAGQHDHGDHDH